MFSEYQRSLTWEGKGKPGVGQAGRVCACVRLHTHTHTQRLCFLLSRRCCPWQNWRGPSHSQPGFLRVFEGRPGCEASEATTPHSVPGQCSLHPTPAYIAFSFLTGRGVLGIWTRPWKLEQHVGLEGWKSGWKTEGWQWGEPLEYPPHLPISNLDLLLLPAWP